MWLQKSTTIFYVLKSLYICCICIQRNVANTTSLIVIFSYYATHKEDKCEGDGMFKRLWQRTAELINSRTVMWLGIISNMPRAYFISQHQETIHWMLIFIRTGRYCHCRVVWYNSILFSWFRVSNIFRCWLKSDIPPSVLPAVSRMVTGYYSSED